jgi:hypothetical protein
MTRHGLMAMYANPRCYWRQQRPDCSAFDRAASRGTNSSPVWCPVGPVARSSPKSMPSAISAATWNTLELNRKSGTRRLKGHHPAGATYTWSLSLRRIRSTGNRYGRGGQQNEFRFRTQQILNRATAPSSLREASPKPALIPSRSNRCHMMFSNTLRACVSLVGSV